MTQPGPEFFRKYADLITEAESTPVIRKFAQNRDAERYVMKLIKQGKDIEEILADPSVYHSNLSDKLIKNLWANAPDSDDGYDPGPHTPTSGLLKSVRNEIEQGIRLGLSNEEMKRELGEYRDWDPVLDQIRSEMPTK
jgi:hypothetical protein